MYIIKISRTKNLKVSPGSNASFTDSVMAAARWAKKNGKNALVVEYEDESKFAEGRPIGYFVVLPSGHVIDLGPYDFFVKWSGEFETFYAEYYDPATEVGRLVGKAAYIVCTSDISGDELIAVCINGRLCNCRGTGKCTYQIYDIETGEVYWQQAFPEWER